MKFFLPTAISALALIVPALAADLEDRSYRYYQQAHNVNNNSGHTVTVHDTVVSTQTAFVTVTVGQDQAAQCTQAADSLETSSAIHNQYQHQNQGQQQTAEAQATTTHTAPHRMETITSTRTYTTAVVHTTPMVVTETTHNSVYVHTVTRTITEHVRQTEVVTSTRLVQQTEFVTDHVTRTVDVEETQTTDAAVADATTTTTAAVADVTTTTTAAAADFTTTTSTGDAGIADVNTNVVTVTDVETSTFLFTTTVDGVAATETGTTTITSDASTSTTDASTSTTTDASTSTDVGGNIADVTTSNSETATTTSSAASTTGTDDFQTSLTLDPRVIESNFAQDGQATPTAGQVRSLTSTNNFINFCLTQPVPLTDGKQIRTGSCNVVPQGFIIAKDRLPSAKFVFPVNFSRIPANQQFTAKLKIKNLQAGAFTNANLNYYAAPAQVNGQGILIGHSHLVIEKINGLDDTEPADPTKFAFFKGLNLPLDGDSTLSATLANGLPAGTYRMFSINTASNHQPALASIAQHGSMDDGVYFTAE